VKLFSCLLKSVVRGRKLTEKDTADKQKDFLLLSLAEQDTQDTDRCFHFYAKINLRISSFTLRHF